MRSTVRPLARQLRAIVFINHLILAIGCKRMATDLQRWGEAFEERRGLGFGGGGTGKWRRYLDGVLPRGALLDALIDEFPVLSEVLDDPLWIVLRRFEDPKPALEELIAQLRFDGEPVRRGKLTRLQRRMDAGYWQDLGCLLVILANPSAAHSRIREFVQDRMLLFLLLICLQPEFTGTEARLFQVLHHHVRIKLIKIRCWPRAADGLIGLVHHFRSAARRAAEIIREEMHLAETPRLEVAFTCLGDELGCSRRNIYSAYWDQDWERLPLNAKAKQWLYPPLQMSLVPATSTINSKKRGIEP